MRGSTSSPPSPLWDVVDNTVCKLPEINGRSTVEHPHGKHCSIVDLT